MTTSPDDMHHALAEVRRAARVLAAWQQRVNEVYFETHRALEDAGLAHRWSGSNRTAPLPKPSQVPYAPHRWPWDLLPGLYLASEWVGAGPAGQVRVYMALDTDTAFAVAPQQPGQGPDPERFPGVDDPVSRTELWLGLYTVTPADPPWAEVRGSVLADRWREGLERELAWEHAGWRGTYACRCVPVQALVSAEAVQARLVGPLLSWVQPRLA